MTRNNYTVTSGKFVKRGLNSVFRSSQKSLPVTLTIVSKSKQSQRMLTVRFRQRRQIAQCCHLATWRGAALWPCGQTARPPASEAGTSRSSAGYARSRDRRSAPCSECSRGLSTPGNFIKSWFPLIIGGVLLVCYGAPDPSAKGLL